jgi:hypothetical protein
MLYCNKGAASRSISATNRRVQKYPFAIPRLSPTPEIRVCDDAGNLIEAHEHAGEFKE